MMRPHERRAQAGRAMDTTEDPFGKITPPTFDTLEALQKAFPVTLPDASGLGSPAGAGEYTLSMVQRQLGQQDVIQFLTNLTTQARGE